MTDRDDWPVHQPEAPEAPIPGRHWYASCDPDRPRIDPATGLCDSCGEPGCPICGRANCPDHAGDWIAGYLIDFTDGGEPEGQLLARGTLEECERIGELIPAIAYSGSRPISGARVVIAPAPRDPE